MLTVTDVPSYMQQLQTFLKTIKFFKKFFRPIWPSSRVQMLALGKAPCSLALTCNPKHMRVYSSGMGRRSYATRVSLSLLLDGWDG
jgi:hypothetical protein